MCHRHRHHRTFLYQIARLVPSPDDWTGLYLAPFLHQAEGLFPYAAYRIESECSLQYPLLFERVSSAYSFA